jgi:hypothetical protein
MNEAIKVIDGKLFFGKHEVRDYEVKDGEPICQLFAIRVPELVVREDGTSYTWWKLATTMDIPDDGDLIWLCGWSLSDRYSKGYFTLPSAYYDSWSSIEYILNELHYKSAGKEWAIFTDDDFLKNPIEDDYYYPDDDE